MQSWDSKPRLLTPNFFGVISYVLSLYENLLIFFWISSHLSISISLYALHLEKF